jgi:hypothetical protein
MALLNEAVKNKKFDIRVIERNVQRGVVSQEEANRAQRDLPDDAENAQWITIDELRCDESEDTGSYSSPGTSNSSLA